MAFFKMPFDVALFFGYTLASVGPAMVINIMTKLINSGKGVKIGLTQYVLAAISLDDVIAVVMGGVLSTIAINRIPSNGNPESVGIVILTLAYNLGAGLFCSLLAFMGYLFNKIKNNKLR